MALLNDTMDTEHRCRTSGDLGWWDDHFIEPLSRITFLLRTAGAVPGIQLGHAGCTCPGMVADLSNAAPISRTGMLGSRSLPARCPAAAAARMLTAPKTSGLDVTPIGRRRRGLL